MRTRFFVAWAAVALCAGFSADVRAQGEPVEPGDHPPICDAPDACPPVAPEPPAEAPADCPREMLRVGSFCVDRWEVSFVDHTTSLPLSPFYPPEPRLLRAAREYWQVERFNTGDESARGMPLPEVPEIERTGTFVGRAVSLPGVIPQAYLSYPLAKRGCELAGKRLCSKDEWVTACRGARRTPYPYGATYQAGRCNVYRLLHPAFVLHGNASLGHRDPRLNLLIEEGRDPLVHNTGETPACRSVWGDDAAYDMVGNLDEWIEDDTGTFVGGFYARSTKKGCEAQVTVHSPDYYDYSLGARCCRDVGVHASAG